MKPPGPPPPPLLLLPRHLLFPLLLLLLFFPLHAAAGSTPSGPRCLASERIALLQFKAGLRGTDRRLSSWRGSDCCQWSGVACDNRTGAVVKLDLRNPYPFDPPPSPRGFGNLSGRLDPSLLQLRSLAFLDLSGNRFDGGPIPPWLGSLTQLKHLGLSYAGFDGAVPPQLGNLSGLQFLDVSCLSQSPPCLYAETLNWLSGLSSLRYLSMNGVDLSQVGSGEFFHLLNSQLPSLAELHLAGCGLSAIPHSLSSVNFTSLAVVDLSWNTFASNTIPTWLLNATNLVSLSLRSCGLQGAIPPGLWELRSLKTLLLLLNNFSGDVPSSMGKLCNLEVLYLSSNNLTGELPQTLEYADTCDSGLLSSLVELDLSDNRISGNLPGWVGELKSLKDLSLESNMFSGSLPLSLGKLSKLTIFSASSNRLEGEMLEAHFAGLKNLKSFYISDNPALAANVSPDWTPPFQVVSLFMGSCQLGPKFPAWIRNQKQLQMLDFSNTGISDTIPTWFWGLSPELTELDLSSNRISGTVPESIAEMKGLTSLDLSNNLFSGSIPSSLASMAIKSLDLSSNNFSGEVPLRGGLAAFNMSAFNGNPYLCGPPTDVHCARDHSQGGQAGEEGRHCSPRDTATRVALFFLGVAVGVAALLLHQSVSKCYGSFRKQDAKAKATPSAAGQLKQVPY